MKGILRRNGNVWSVIYKGNPHNTNEETELPLHPDDADSMPFLGQLPNNQHILDGKDIDFDIVYSPYPDKFSSDSFECSKLNWNKCGFVKSKMYLGKYTNDKLWDEIYEEYSSDQYPPFGGPFTDSLSFIDWLKMHRIAPDRIPLSE